MYLTKCWSLACKTPADVVIFHIDENGIDERICCAQCAMFNIKMQFHPKRFFHYQALEEELRYEMRVR